MTRKYSLIIVSAFIFVIIVIIGFQFLNESGENQNPQISTSPESAAQTSYLKTQINNEGAVEIAVTPKNLSDNEWDFEIELNTHSMEIGEDLTRVAVLIDGNGNERKPIEWQGDLPGGHHRQGVLRFASISPQPSSITLKIFQVGEIKERIFIWQFK